MVLIFRVYIYLKLLVRAYRSYGKTGVIDFVRAYRLSVKETYPKDFQSNLRLSLSNAKDNKFYVNKREDAVDSERCAVKAIAFYLPQYHPINENDKWWGAGFTEWTNVSKATPQYAGQYQPHLPGELGFYDLRLRDNQEKQIKLARHYGISGFCYHYYWFAGRKLLETPLTNMLNDTSLDFPFCLCWANESWTRRWDGSESDVLIRQEYSEDNDIAFIKDIEVALKDTRYIKVNDRPIIIVYRVSDLPNPMQTATRWREYCRKVGIGEIHLVAALSFDIKNPLTYGFDAGVEFPPHNVFSAKIPRFSLKLFNKNYSGISYCYQGLIAGEIALKKYNFPCYRTAFPSWDNEARKPGKGTSYKNSSPLSYKRWLSHLFECAHASHNLGEVDEPMVFINAWNEWAEGAHLEPDRKYGYAYLEATAEVIKDFS